MNSRKLEVWKRSKALAIEVYKELSSLKDFGFKDQITRFALSVPLTLQRVLRRDIQKKR